MNKPDVAVCKECGSPARKPVEIIGCTVCHSCALQFAVRVAGNDGDDGDNFQDDDSTCRMDMED